jgi:hypothetical protein
MSISSLTTHAAQLLAYFDGQKAEINAALSAALAAVNAPALVHYYIDPIAGDDGNAGTSAAPFASLAPVRTALNNRSGISARIYLARDAEVLFNQSISVDNSLLHFQQFDPRTVGAGLPALQMTATSDGAKDICTSVVGRNNQVRLTEINLFSPAAVTNPPARDGHWGLCRGIMNNVVSLADCTLTLRDWEIADHRLTYLYLYEVEIARHAEAAATPPVVSFLGDVPCMLYGELLTLPEGETLTDVFAVTESANVLTNLALGG